MRDHATLLYRIGSNDTANYTNQLHVAHQYGD